MGFVAEMFPQQVASAPKFLQMPNPFGEAESDANSVVGQDRWNIGTLGDMASDQISKLLKFVELWFEQSYESYV